MKNKQWTCLPAGRFHGFRTGLHRFLITLIFNFFLLVAPALADNEIPVQLRIENEAGTVLSTNIQLPESCDVIDTTTTTPNHFTGYKAICALQTAQEQGLLTYQVTNWGFAFALDNINGVANAADWSKTWLIFQNVKDPGMGIDGFSLQANDELLLTYSAWPANPLQISANMMTGAVGDTISLNVLTWNSNTNGFDLVTAPSTTITIDGTGYETNGGTLNWQADTEGEKSAIATANGYTRSAIIRLTVTPTTTPEVLPPTPPVSNCCSSDPAPISKQTFNPDLAIQFLSSANSQQINGSILGSPLYSDWTAIAFASYSGNNPGKELLKQYLLTDPTPVLGLNETADYARRSMALMSLGINPYSGTNTNYIQKLTSKFNGNSFGGDELYNDDIFALFPLLHAGYSSSDPIIVSTTAFILSKQENNGAWSGTDLTAAAVQSLAQVQNLPGVSQALENAKLYLHTQQNDNGSFNDNIFSTSWGMQAITALGEPDANWTKNNFTPKDYLAEKQSSADGGMDSADAPMQNRVWSTAYAVPSALGKTWTSLLTTFEKPVEQTLPRVEPPIAPPTVNPTIISTTTAPMVTSTLPIVEVATSTEPIVTTSTPPLPQPPVFVPAVPKPTPQSPQFPTPKSRQAVAGTRIENNSNADINTNTEDTVKDVEIETTNTKQPAPEPSKSSSPAVPVAVAGTIGVAIYLGWKFLGRVV